MKKISLIIVIVLAITVIGMTTGLSFAWFASEERMNSTIIHQANSPSANVEVINVSQTGTLAPAIPFVDSDGVPSYISDPSGFETYVATYGLLTAGGNMIDTAATIVEVSGQFKYEGKDDNGLDIGTRTLVVELVAQNHTTAEQIAKSNFSTDFVADDDNDDETPACIVSNDSDRTNYTSGSTPYYGVHVITVTPAIYETDWYWFTITIYFSQIDDEMDTSLNGTMIDFTINIIAP